MNEIVFWSLSEEAREDAVTADETTERLISLLEKFSATEIKQFQKLLSQKIELSNHWDIWALAYLAQDGCADDAFESFRCWLILQGQSIFESAIEDVVLVMNSVPRRAGTNADHLLSCPSISFENRSGKPLKWRSTKTKTKGRQWSESSLEVRHPILWNYFKSGQ